MAHVQEQTANQISRVTEQLRHQEQDHANPQVQLRYLAAMFDVPEEAVLAAEQPLT